MSAAPRPRTVDRRIHFFRADAGANSGRPIPLDLSTTLASLDTIAFNAATKRYWQRDARSEPVAAWLFGSGTSLLTDRLAYAVVRRSALPMVELDGTLSDIPLATRQGLYESTHVRFFDHNIVGVEFNFYAPRTSSLSAYLKQAVPTAQDFVLEPLLRNDVLAQLSMQSSLKVMELQVRRSYASALVAAGASIGRAMEALATATRAEVIGITLRPEKNQRTELAPKISKFVRKAIRQPDLRANALRFHIKGVNSVTGDTDEIDLLQDQLVSEEAILAIGAKSRAVDSSSAFDAIERAYQNLEPELLTAAGVVLRATPGP